MTSSGAGGELDEIGVFVERALPLAREGSLRAIDFRRLATVLGLDDADRVAAVDALGTVGVLVDGDVAADTGRPEPDDEPSDDELGEAPAVTRTPEDLERCVASARRLLKGRGAGLVPRHHVLTADQEAGLAVLTRGKGRAPHEGLPSGHRAGLDDTSEPARAFDALVEHNMRLVWSIARAHGDFRMDQEDIQSSGMFGLLRAVEKFDATRGLKFSTYATWWIRQSISRALANEACAIRLPVHVDEQVRRMRATWSRLYLERDEVTVKDVARALGVSPDRVRWLLSVSNALYSLDKPLSADASLTLADVIPVEGDLFDDFARSDARRVIEKVLSTLTDREQRVMRMRYGLDTGEPMTLDEIGKEFDLTRERIRQIQEKCLKKLRSRGPAALLRPLVEG